MKSILIKASPFFELLKIQDTSMWQIFSEMIDGEEKEIVFLNDDNQMLFSYNLPSTIEKLQEDQKIFAKEYAEKIIQTN